MSARRVFSLLGSLSRRPSALPLGVSSQPHFSRSWISTCGLLRSEPAPQSRSDEFETLVNKMRRPQTRKRRPVMALSHKFRGPSVVSIPLGQNFDLQGITNDQGLNSMYDVKFIDEEFDDALYLIKKNEYTVNRDELSEIFLFKDGVVVFWNVEANQRANILRELERFTSRPYDSRIALEEQDRMPFSTIEGNSCIKSDRFLLSKAKHEGSRTGSTSILERFAFSQGFAASVKIGVWEALLNEMAEPVAIETESLMQGKIPWSRKETLIKSGQFNALKNSINLNCGLLNTDFYWENREDIEQYYKMSARHFTLNRRLNELNARLDQCAEQVKMVDSQLAVRHGTKLEWMIIVLIMIEVFFGVFHFGDRFSPQEIVATTPMKVNSDEPLRVVIVTQPSSSSN